jgi:hypothetical protein
MAAASKDDLVSDASLTKLYKVMLIDPDAEAV